MRKRTCLLFITARLTLLGGHRICEAAHLGVSGSSAIHVPLSLTLTQYQWCNFTYQSLSGGTTTIEPDGAEQIVIP